MSGAGQRFSTSTSRRPAMSCQSGPSPCVHEPDRRGEPEERLTMTIVITAWDRWPDGGMGLARDTRVRWALEEVGQPYEVRFVSLRTKQEPAHLRLQPFGLIPTYEERRSCLVRHRRDRLAYRRPPCGTVSRRCQCAGARDHL